MAVRIILPNLSLPFYTSAIRTVFISLRCTLDFFESLRDDEYEAGKLEIKLNINICAEIIAFYIFPNVD